MSEVRRFKDVLKATRERQIQGLEVIELIGKSEDDKIKIVMNAMKQCLLKTSADILEDKNIDPEHAVVASYEDFGLKAFILSTYDPDHDMIKLKVIMDSVPPPRRVDFYELVGSYNDLFPAWHFGIQPDTDRAIMSSGMFVTDQFNVAEYVLLLRYVLINCAAYYPAIDELIYSNISPQKILEEHGKKRERLLNEMLGPISHE